MIELIEQAYREDLPSGDLTTDNLGRQNIFGQAKLVAKQDLTLSGTEIFTQSILHMEPEARVHWHFHNKDLVLSGQTICQIDGNLVQILKAERVALNFLGYLSGIATQTKRFVDACQGTHTQILDTRKTLPLYRRLAKQAVVDGGGTNHRMDLSSAIMIKENHIAVAGGLEKAVNSLRAHTSLPIELEVQNLDEVKQAVNLGIERVLLDNMSLEDMGAAMKLIPKTMQAEASGNMTLERIPGVAATGVHFISVGALTHSVPTADISLLFDWPS